MSTQTTGHVCYNCKGPDRPIVSLFCNTCKEFHDFCELHCIVRLDSLEHFIVGPQIIATQNMKKLTESEKEKVRISLVLSSVLEDNTFFKFFFQFINKKKHLYGLNFRQYILIIQFLLNRPDFKRLNMFISECLLTHLEIKKHKNTTKEILDNLYYSSLVYIFLCNSHKEGDEKSCLHACEIVEKLFRFGYEPIQNPLIFEKEPGDPVEDAPRMCLKGKEALLYVVEVKEGIMERRRNDVEEAKAEKEEEKVQ